MIYYRVMVTKPYYSKPFLKRNETKRRTYVTLWKVSLFNVLATFRDLMEQLECWF